MKTIEIRPATTADSLFVAQCVCMALHNEPLAEDLPLIANICRRDDVLYSYRNALIAWLDDQPVGLCLAYPGDDYHATRLRTFALFERLWSDKGEADKNDDMDLENAEDETGPGEYYIDSLAVLPPFRRRGYARLLMQAQMAHGQRLGYQHQTLLVDPDNSDAQKLYHQLGFAYESDCYAFGQTYWKWGVLLK